MVEKLENKAIITIIIILLIELTIMILIRTDPYLQVKKGKKELWCFIKNKGFMKIPNEKIISYIDDENIWIFTNGYAKNCEIRK